MRNNWGSGNVNNKHNEATITFDTPERDATDAGMRHGKQARDKFRDGGRVLAGIFKCVCSFL